MRLKAVRLKVGEVERLLKTDCEFRSHFFLKVQFALSSPKFATDISLLL